ncbi:MAG TPA: MBL fold metallo-hydrolase, partial [Gemmatimonadales bacterium]|nr:MBL fold metallo-hydrolase [Gemmatimonadales bacterium]
STWPSAGARSVSDLELVCLPNGQLAENCYLLADRKTRQAVIIDPGEEARLFLAELDTRAWTLSAIWLTHAHLDHAMGVREVKAATGAPVFLHPLDRALYEALPRQGEWYGIKVEPQPQPDMDLADGQRLQVGNLEFTVRHTPGHSPGSVSFLCPGLVIGGDVLFSGSIGRSDLPGGNGSDLMQSIQSVFLTLPDSTTVYSGHGPETTIGVERMTNPFLTGVHRFD